MESTATRAGIDLAARPARAGLALVLALLSVPGSTLAWDSLPGGGFVFGFPPAIAAIVLGVQALQWSRTGRAKALAAIAIGGAMIAMMVIFTIVEAL